MHVSDQQKTLATGALTERVSRRTVKTFYRTFSTQHPSVRSLWTPTRRVAAGVGSTAAVIGLLAMATGMTLEAREGAPDMFEELIAMSVIAGLLLTGGSMMVWFYVRTTLRRGTPTRHYRLARFAAENGMTYSPGPLGGSHLTPWADRGQLELSRVMRVEAPRAMEFANYLLTSRPNDATRIKHFGGYCAVRLATFLPHIVLEARGGVPAALTTAALPARTQKLSLGGDFDRHFTLYCPEGYQQDALYLFTPDVMARLIDRVQGFDIEIIDDWLFFVRGGDVVTLDPAIWHGLQGATSALTDKIGRWERWRDDSMPAPTAVAAVGSAPADRAGGRVATPGRRLRQAFGSGTLIWVLPTAVLMAAVIIANAI